MPNMQQVRKSRSSTDLFQLLKITSTRKVKKVWVKLKKTSIKSRKSANDLPSTAHEITVDTANNNNKSINTSNGSLPDDEVTSITPEITVVVPNNKKKSINTSNASSPDDELTSTAHEITVDTAINKKKPIDTSNASFPNDEPTINSHSTTQMMEESENKSIKESISELPSSQLSLRLKEESIKSIQGVNELTSTADEITLDTANNKNKSINTSNTSVPEKELCVNSNSTKQLIDELDNMFNG